MTKDPVCGMNVAEDSQFKATHDGVTYVFCSASCKAKFEQAPERFARPAGGPGHPPGHSHSCC